MGATSKKPIEIDYYYSLAYVSHRPKCHDTVRPLLEIHWSHLYKPVMITISYGPKCHVDQTATLDIHWDYILFNLLNTLCILKDNLFCHFIPDSVPVKVLTFRWVNLLVSSWCIDYMLLFSNFEPLHILILHLLQKFKITLLSFSE